MASDGSNVIDSRIGNDSILSNSACSRSRKKKKKKKQRCKFLENNDADKCLQKVTGHSKECIHFESPVNKFAMTNAGVVEPNFEQILSCKSQANEHIDNSSQENVSKSSTSRKKCIKSGKSKCKSPTNDTADCSLKEGASSSKAETKLESSVNISSVIDAGIGQFNKASNLSCSPWKRRRRRRKRKMRKMRIELRKQQQKVPESGDAYHCSQEVVNLSRSPWSSPWKRKRRKMKRKRRKMRIELRKQQQNVLESGDAYHCSQEVANCSKGDTHLESKGGSSIDRREINHFEEDVPKQPNLESTGIKNVDELMIRSQSAAKSCGISSLEVDGLTVDGKDKTQKRKLHLSKVSDSNSAGMLANHNNSLVKSQVSEKLCDIIQTIDGSLHEKHIFEDTFANNHSKNENFMTHKGWERRHSSQSERDRSLNSLHTSPEKGASFIDGKEINHFEGDVPEQPNMDSTGIKNIDFLEGDLSKVSDSNSAGMVVEHKDTLVKSQVSEKLCDIRQNEKDISDFVCSNPHLNNENIKTEKSRKRKSLRHSEGDRALHILHTSPEKKGVSFIDVPEQPNMDTAGIKKNTGILEGDLSKVSDSKSAGMVVDHNNCLIKSQVTGKLCDMSQSIDGSLYQKLISDVVIANSYSKNENIMTYKSKKRENSSHSESAGMVVDHDNSLVKSKVSEKLCDMSQSIDSSFYKKRFSDAVFANPHSKRENIKTYKRWKRENSSQSEGDRPLHMQTSPEKPFIICTRKLLILDVNGLLADFVLSARKDYKPDARIAKKSVFKRPFCDDFIRFCFENFDLGVWSSRTKYNLDDAVNFLFRGSRKKLLFCWDQFHCTRTKLKAPENRSKPVFLKELRKLWDKHDQKLPWEKGFYNEFNTLLLDDSPYKALRNPPYTAIFPHPYRYDALGDNSLGPGGDIRVYLEGLAMAGNVQKYVELNPFGQSPISRTDPYWAALIS